MADLLQQWRLRCTFDVPALRNHFFTEEVVEFKEQIWNTLANDPLFSDPDEELCLNQKRELCLKRMKRLVEYEFLNDETLILCPLKAPGFYSALLTLDPGMFISWQLSTEVRICQPSRFGAGQGGTFGVRAFGITMYPSPSCFCLRVLKCHTPPS